MELKYRMACPKCGQAVLTADLEKARKCPKCSKLVRFIPPEDYEAAMVKRRMEALAEKARAHAQILETQVRDEEEQKRLEWNAQVDRDVEQTVKEGGVFHHCQKCNRNVPTVVLSEVQRSGFLWLGGHPLLSIAGTLWLNRDGKITGCPYCGTQGRPRKVGEIDPMTAVVGIILAVIFFMIALSGGCALFY